MLKKVDENLQELGWFYVCIYILLYCLTPRTIGPSKKGVGLTVVFRMILLDLQTTSDLRCIILFSTKGSDYVRLLYSILDFIGWFSLRWLNQHFFLWNIRRVVKLPILSVYLDIYLDNVSHLSCCKSFDYVHLRTFDYGQYVIEWCLFHSLPKLSCCHPKQFPGNPG